MRVLSLFDGISCGRLALERAGVAVTNYYASEIDKHAIKVSKNNYPDIVQLGDVNDWQNWGDLDVDLVIGGSPCQGFSFAGKQLAFDDPRSALFWKFVDILNYYKPKYFLLENVRMKKEYQDVISKALGVEPIVINSSLVSAQNRVRWYWVGQRRETAKFRCLFCMGGDDERAGIQRSTQDQGEGEVLGETQKRHSSLQSMSESLFEDREERNDKDLFSSLCGRKQEKFRPSKRQKQDKSLPSTVSQIKPRRNTGVSETVQKDGDGKVSSKEGRREKMQEDSSCKIHCCEISQKAPRLGEVRCVQCGGGFNNRPQNTSDQRWGEYIGELTSFMSAVQLGQTYYYRKLNITQPSDKGILLKDVLENPGVVGTMTGRRLNSEGEREGYNYSTPTVVYRCNDNKRVVGITENSRGYRPHRGDERKTGISELGRILKQDSKTDTVTSSHAPKLAMNDDIKDLTYRFLTAVECERLQTLPDDYTAAVSDTQRYKMLGNAWTVDVLAHIFKGLL